MGYGGTIMLAHMVGMAFVLREDFKKLSAYELIFPMEAFYFKGKVHKLVFIIFWKKIVGYPIRQILTAR